MGRAEYVVQFKGDYSALQKDINKINGETRKLANDEVIIKLNYDGNIKEFNKVFDEISKSHPELGIQFQYNVNQKILEQELGKLDQLTELKLDVDNGKVQEKLEKMADGIESALQNKLSKDEITKQLTEYFGYYNTAIKAGAKRIDIDSINNRLVESFEIEEDEIKKIFDNVFDFNASKPYQLFKLDTSINEEINITKDRVQDLKDTIKSLEERGASKTGLPSDLQKVQDEIKILRSDIQYMQEQLKNLSGDAFNEMTESIKETNRQLSDAIDKIRILSMTGTSDFKASSLKSLMGLFSEFARVHNNKNLSSFWDELQTRIDNGDESLKTLLSDLKLFNVETGKLDIVGHGNVKSGGLLSNDNVLLATKDATKQSDNTIKSKLEDTIVLKQKLDEAADAGVNVSRILNIVYDKVSDTMFELQETAKGTILGGQGEAPINIEAFEASEEQIQKLISDILYLRKIGVGVDFHGLNVLYDKIKGFSLIDLDLNPVEYDEKWTFEGDILGGLTSSFENENGELSEAAKKFIDKVESVLKNIDTSEIESSAKEATQKAADALQEAQDSNSPAELTKPLGKDFGLGYAEGIREAMPEIVEACKDIVMGAYNALKETSDAKNGEGNNFLDIFINNLKESLDNAAPTIQEKINEVFSKINIDNKSEKSPLSSIASEDFQTQFQNTINETGEYIIRVYGELIDDFKSRLQNSIDETGIYHVDIEGWLYDTFHDGLQRDIDGQEKYIIEVKGRLFDSFKEVLQEAIENLGAFPIEVKPYMRKGGEIEEVDLPGDNQNNLSSEGTTTPSAIDEITQAEDRMGNEAQEATEQARQGLAEMRDEAEATEEVIKRFQQRFNGISREDIIRNMNENFGGLYGVTDELIDEQVADMSRGYETGVRDLIEEWKNVYRTRENLDEEAQQKQAEHLFYLKQKISEYGTQWVEELSRVATIEKELFEKGVNLTDNKPHNLQESINQIPQKEGTTRLIHWTDKESANKILGENFDYSKYTDITNTVDILGEVHRATQIVEADLDSLHQKGWDKGAAVIIDVPTDMVEELTRAHEIFDKNSFIPNEYIQGIIDTNEYVCQLNESEKQLVDTQQKVSQQSNQTPVSTEGSTANINAETEALAEEETQAKATAEAKKEAAKAGEDIELDGLSGNTESLLTKKQVIEQLRSELNLTKKAAEELFKAQDYKNPTGIYQIEQSAVTELIASLKEKKQIEESTTPTTSPVTDNMQSEVEAVNQAIESEKKKFDELKNKISKTIPNAIAKKNKAFKEEAELVSKLVGGEAKEFDNLKNSVDSVTDKVKESQKVPKDTKSKTKTSSNTSDEVDKDALLQKHYTDLRRDAFQSIGQKSQIQQDMSEYYTQLEKDSAKAYSDAEKKANSLLDKVKKLQSSNKYTQDFKNDLNTAETELRTFLGDLTSGTISFDQLDGKVKELSDNIEGTLARKAFGSVKQAAEKSLTNVGLKIDQIIAKNSAMGKEFESRFKALRKELNGAQSIEAVQKIIAEVNKLESELIATGNTGKSFIDQIKQRLRDINSKYIAQYFSFQDIIRYARQAATNVIQLNDAFIELSKVSNTSLETLEKDFQSYADIAHDIGGTITDTINATADWARMGMINAPLYGNI